MVNLFKMHSKSPANTNAIEQHKVIGNLICTLRKYFIFTLVFLPLKGFSDEDKIKSIINNTSINLIPDGGKNSGWTFQFSRDLRDWENIAELSPVFSDEESSAPNMSPSPRLD